MVLASGDHQGDGVMLWQDSSELTISNYTFINSVNWIPWIQFPRLYWKLIKRPFKWCHHAKFILWEDESIFANLAIPWIINSPWCGPRPKNMALTNPLFEGLFLSFRKSWSFWHWIPPFNQWFGCSFSCHNLHELSFVLLFQRQRSVSLLMRLINIFTAGGRHKFYSHLLHTVCHGGVVGLLVHSLKNEVDTALNVRGVMAGGSVVTLLNCPTSYLARCELYHYYWCAYR